MLDQKPVHQGFYTVHLCHFEHSLYQGGKTGPVERELLERGNVAAVLPYDPADDSVVLVEQFRIGAMNHDNPWLTEVIAGMVEKGESPEEMVRREAKEEAGLDVNELLPIAHYLSSPGSSTEEVYLYAAITDLSSAGGYHGLEEENEDIRVIKLSADEAIKLFDTGVVKNALSVIAMQWFKANLQNLRAGKSA